MGRHTSNKVARSPMISYNRKVAKITKWYKRLVAIREQNPIVINPNNKLEIKRRPLKELSYYIEKIAKAKERN
jgi:hypothetical protein